MKLPEIEPVWGLALGFFIAPIACVINATLLGILLGGWEAAPTGQYLSITFLSLILTGPMGFLTTRLLQIWKKGDTGKARGMAFSCGVFSLFFWLWARTGLEIRWGQHSSPTLIGALLLPFIWSMLFPLFAIFARPPQN
jgi:hypothetical protein